MLDLHERMIASEAAIVAGGLSGKTRCGCMFLFPRNDIGISLQEMMHTKYPPASLSPAASFKDAIGIYRCIKNYEQKSILCVRKERDCKRL